MSDHEADTTHEMSDALDDDQLLAMLQEIVYQTGSLTQYAQYYNPEGMRAALVALRDSLNRHFPATVDADDTDAKKVLAAFDEEMQRWVRAGVPLSHVKMWDVYHVRPPAAAAWESAGVPPEYALYFSRERFDAQWWGAWATVHGLSDDGATAAAQMFNLLAYSGRLRLTPTTLNKWVAAGVPVWDVEGWFSAGYTPAKAKTAIKKGVTVKQVAAHVAPVPGPSWPKVSALATNYKWAYAKTERQATDGMFFATWGGAGGHKLVARFKADGKFDGCHVETKERRTVRAAQSIRATDSMLASIAEALEAIDAAVNAPS